MAFEVGEAYPDALGRRWYVAFVAMVQGRKVLNVVMRNQGSPPIYGIAVVEDGSHATLLHADGYTTLYAEGDEE